MAKIDFFTTPEDLISKDLKPGTQAYSTARSRATDRIEHALRTQAERGASLAAAEEGVRRSLSQEGQEPTQIHATIQGLKAGHQARELRKFTARKL